MQSQQQAQYTLQEIVEAMYDFSDYSQDEKETVLDETMAMITQAALMRGLDALDQAAQDNFNQFMETNPDEDQMNDYIQKNIPDFQKLVIEEIAVFDSMGNDETSTN